MSQAPLPLPSHSPDSVHVEDETKENLVAKVPPEMDADFSEFEQFDWNKFNKSVTEPIEPELSSELEETTPTEPEAKPDNTILRTWLAQRLMPQSIEVLIKEVPVKELWKWLSEKEQLNFRTQLLRGFQQTPQILRNPAVRNRLVKFLEKERIWLIVYVLLWGQKTPPHPLVELLENEEQDAVIINRLPSIFKEYGPHLLMCAAAYHARPLLFKIIYDFVLSPTELFENENAEVAVEASASETLPEELEAAPEPAPHLAELERARDNIARLNAHNEILTAQIKSLQKENAALKAKEKQTITQWEKKFELGLKKAEKEILELKRQEERQSRRLHKAEREREEFEANLKRTQKQLRNAQQLLETERKQILQLNARLENTNPEEKQPPTQAASAVVTPQSQSKLPAKPLSNSPLDEIFEWQADGRQVRLSARQVKKLIDQNNEDELYVVQMALEVLESKNLELYNRFLHRLGTIDLSYRRVLTSPTQRVLVDASNVVRSQTKNGRGMLKLLLSARDELRSRGAWPIILVADASLRHNIDEGKKFQEMINSGEVIQSDKGVEADEILAREARRTGASVVTNDARFFHKVSPDFEPPRITFRVFDGTVLVNDF